VKSAKRKKGNKSPRLLLSEGNASLLFPSKEGPQKRRSKSKEGGEMGLGRQAVGYTKKKRLKRRSNPRSPQFYFRGKRKKKRDKMPTNGVLGEAKKKDS